MFLAYAWLRFDVILRITFKDNWTPRYEFMASIFGEKDSEDFLKHRVKLVKARNRPKVQIVTADMVETKVKEFLKTKNTTKSGQEERFSMIKRLIYWSTDQDINQQNADSYKTRTAIVDALLNVMFQNALAEETEMILDGLKKIVFSRITYLGSKGEPSPVVHDAIISGVGRILTSHFNELIRIRDQNLDKLTKVKLIKEIHESKDKQGSLAFSGVDRKDDTYRNRYPLPDKYSRLLLEILKHYRYSAWPESREKTETLIKQMEDNLGFSLEETFE